MHGFAFNGKYMLVLFEMMHVYNMTNVNVSGGGGLKVDGFYLVVC